MPVVVVVHRLKNFDEWLKVFKADPPPKIGRWRLLRGSDDRNRVHVVGEVTASEVKAAKDWIESQHMQDVFKRVNVMSTAPLEFVCKTTRLAHRGTPDDALDRRCWG